MNADHSRESAANEAKERIKREASETAEDLRRHGEEIGATAKARAEAFAADQKEAGARQVESVARAVGKAADELEASSPELARFTREVSARVGSVSDTLRHRSLSDLFNEANHLARREPVAFFGAAMMAGFALSRFLESSSRNSPSGSREHDTQKRSDVAALGGKP
jgi:ABC-type transporter Mla subunit MlaD